MSPQNHIIDGDTDPLWEGHFEVIWASPLQRTYARVHSTLFAWLVRVQCPFLAQNGHIRDKSSGVESYLYPVKEGQLHINLNPGRLFVQQLPKREREAHLNYYASAYNTERQLSHHKTKLNRIRQKLACILNENAYNTKSTHTKTKARCSRLLRHTAWKWSGTILIKWEGMKSKKI